jgi:hypothetical protein
MASTPDGLYARLPLACQEGGGTFAAQSSGALTVSINVHACSDAWPHQAASDAPHFMPSRLHCFASNFGVHSLAVPRAIDPQQQAQSGVAAAPSKALQKGQR